jgi:hypothetical protein
MMLGTVAASAEPSSVGDIRDPRKLRSPAGNIMHMYDPTTTPSTTTAQVSPLSFMSE